MESDRPNDMSSPSSPRSSHPTDGTPAASGATLTVVRADDSVTHVAITGSLDLLGTQRLETAFTSTVTSRRSPTIIDLSGLDFVSSLGIGMLVAASRGNRLRNHPFVLFGAQPEVEAILRGTRLHQVMSIVSTLDEAMAIVDAVRAKPGSS